MKNLRWQIVLSASLVLLSAFLYLLHFRLFHDARHIFIYLLGDIAFLPLEVLLVALIVDRLLAHQERRALLNKLNMVVGAFFSEVGIELLRRFLSFDLAADTVRAKYLVKKEWGAKDFNRLLAGVKSQRYVIDAQAGLDELKGLLAAKREFLLRLLENPNLLEHERFTSLMWAVFHLTEELYARASLARLPQADREHIHGDITRAYSLLIAEWLAYMKHLQRDYPYLFSLAVRMNPFDPNASPEVV